MTSHKNQQFQVVLAYFFVTVFRLPERFPDFALCMVVNSFTIVVEQLLQSTDSIQIESYMFSDVISSDNLFYVCNEQISRG